MGQKPSSKIVQVALQNLVPSSVQPRTIFDGDKINELAESITVHGVLQPLIVRRLTKDMFEIVAGERRFRAGKLSGLRQLPCIIMDIVDEEALAIALVENVQRQDLNPIEEANAYSRLKKTLKLSQEEIASRVGKDRASVANMLRLLRLPEFVQNLVINESLSMGHARALLSLDSVDMMSMVAKKTLREGLSVRKVEAMIRALKAGYNSPEARTMLDANTKKFDPLEKDLRLRLERALGTRVELRREEKGYAVIIHFDGPHQLNGLLDMLNVEM